MREQLIQYVNLLFAGAENAEEIREEILQNTLERYDDLISQGKSPEAAYRLAIGGIGDVNEILGTPTYTHSAVPAETVKEEEPKQNRTMRAVAIAMYILCPVPLFILSEFALETLGLCLTLLLIAAATALLIMIRSKEPEATDSASVSDDPVKQLKRSVGAVIWAVGVGVYFLVSNLTGAWYITWLIFPIVGCIDGLAYAIIDLKEAKKHEN